MAGGTCLGRATRIFMQCHNLSINWLISWTCTFELISWQSYLKDGCQMYGRAQFQCLSRVLFSLGMSLVCSAVSCSRSFCCTYRLCPIFICLILFRALDTGFSNCQIDSNIRLEPFGSDIYFWVCLWSVMRLAYPFPTQLILLQSFTSIPQGANTL